MSMDSCEIGQKRIRDRKAKALCIFDGCKKRESFTVQRTLEAIYKSKYSHFSIMRCKLLKSKLAIKKIEMMTNKYIFHSVMSHCESF